MATGKIAILLGIFATGISLTGCSSDTSSQNETPMTVWAGNTGSTAPGATGAGGSVGVGVQPATTPATNTPTTPAGTNPALTNPTTASTAGTSTGAAGAVTGAAGAAGAMDVSNLLPKTTCPDGFTCTSNPIIDAFVKGGNFCTNAPDTAMPPTCTTKDDCTALGLTNAPCQDLMIAKGCLMLGCTKAP
jgi:hypothetical protein